jgi:hypothetical protein
VSIQTMGWIIEGGVKRQEEGCGSGLGDGKIMVLRSRADLEGFRLHR